MPSLNSILTEALKLTKPQTAAFKKLGIKTIKDLLFFLPYRYLDFSKTSTVKELKTGEDVSIKVKIKSINSRFSFRSHLSLAEALVSDETGSLKAVWFNQGYLAKTLKVNDEIFLSGKPEYYKNTIQLTNPLYELVSEFPVHTARLVPVYHLTQNLYPRTIRNAVKQVLNLADELLEVIPASILDAQKLTPLATAIRLGHFPGSFDDVFKSQQRFNFEEILINQLVAQKYKIELAAKTAHAIKFNQELVKKFVGSLPFTLTDEQKRATWEVLQDIGKPLPMNRLIEGDVGSGKTLVALIAALQAVSQGYQVAFLAPTEILAKQHIQTIDRFFGEIFFHGDKKVLSALLTNSIANIGGEKSTSDEIKKIILKGTAGIYVGTHALIQKSVKFKKLALVIIDEQHRFGVEQRSTLIHGSMRVPHLLSLTATPIPRTLKLALVGELEISQIKQKPQGRKNIITKLVGNTGRPKAYQFIAQEIKNGRQVFVITPLIEENPTPLADSDVGRGDKLGVKSAKKEQALLQKIFPDLQIGLLHGKMKAADKEAAMSDFLANKYQILVSTSVVEVGVDVPNASVMVIEGAERFGLSQLHQFRGRVGRSDHQSYCFLFISESHALNQPNEPGKDDTIKRLEAFTQTQSGFELAELDLKQRGFGKLYGLEQSGRDFKYFDPAYISLIPKAREEAKKLLSNDSELNNYPLLKEKVSSQRFHF